MKPDRISAFSQNGAGGNPAGVVIADHLPESARMQAIAAELGYSETAFAAPDGAGWRVRYFAPACEVPFCGHATIALGAALGARAGAGTYKLILQDAEITVEAQQKDGAWHAALQSPPTWSAPMPDEMCRALLDLLGWSARDLDPALGPLLTSSGPLFAVFAVKERTTLAGMSYPFEAMQAFMQAHDLVTLNLLHITAPRHFVSRNVFASGGVVEDPATGAAAAALGGALVDLDWDNLRNGGSFDVMQGEDMGQPSALRVEVTGVPGDSVRVSGAVHWIT